MTGCNKVISPSRFPVLTAVEILFQEGSYKSAGDTLAEILQETDNFSMDKFNQLGGIPFVFL